MAGRSAGSWGRKEGDRAGWSKSLTCWETGSLARSAHPLYQATLQNGSLNAVAGGGAAERGRKPHWPVRGPGTEHHRPGRKRCKLALRTLEVRDRRLGVGRAGLPRGLFPQVSRTSVLDFLFLKGPQPYGV